MNDIKIDNRDFLHKVSHIAVPIALQSIIASSLSLVDNLMVGSLGETELAAVGVALQIYFVHWMMIFGFTSGVSTYMAQFLGAGDEKSMKKTIGIALTVCLALSGIYFIIGMFFPNAVMQVFSGRAELMGLGSHYIRIGSVCFLTIAITVPLQTALRVTKQTHIPLFISVAVFSTNTFLNYCLIFGKFGFPQLGVAGAAIATVTARSIELIATLSVVFVMKNRIAGKPCEYFGWEKEFFVRIIKNAVPTMANETIWGLGNAMYVAAYARVGVTAYAAVQVGNVINSMFSLAAFSLGDAALILVGEKLGNGETDYAYALGKKILRTSIWVGIIFGLGLFSVSHILVELFDLTAQGKHYAVLVIGVYAIFMTLVLYNGIVVVGLLRAGGDTLFAMIIETGSVWMYAVPMAFITGLLFHLPIYWVVFMVKTEEILKCAVLTKRIISKKWVKNMVHDISS